jgi:hypothetical protein
VIDAKVSELARRRTGLSRLSCYAATLLLAGCAVTHAPTPKPRAIQPEVFAPAGIARRVVLFSFDGLAADDAGLFGSTFNRLADAGTRALRVVPVNPTQTFPTHTAILTGAPPEKNGIVANRFHLPGTPRNETASGVEAKIGVETLVEAAHRAGKQVGSIAFPTIDGTSPERRSDFGLVYGKAVSLQRVIRLKSSDFHAAWMPAGWGAPKSTRASFSPVMRSRLEWSIPAKARHDVDIAAYDTTDDSRRNYDTLFIEIDGIEQPLQDNGWFAVSAALPNGLYGSWSKVVKHDAALDDVTIYWGAITHAQAFPEDFRQLLESEAGFWPAPPDDEYMRKTLEGGLGIDPETFIEQQQRLSQYLEKATVLAIQRMPFDLLLSYQPVIDSAQHQFRITEDRQKDASLANRAEGEKVRFEAFRSFDRVLNAVTAQLHPASDALIVTGDHGVGTIDTEVRLGALLAGWSVADRWSAFAGGGTAHLYRFGEPDDSAALMAKLVALRAPDGSPVFERVEQKNSMSNPNSGDLVLYAWPRFSLVPGGGQPFVTPPYYGQHGALNTHREFHTTLLAWGAGVPKETIESIRQTQIARYVSQLMGIDPPSAAE